MADSRAKWFVGTVLTLCTIGLVVGPARAITTGSTLQA